MCHVLMSDHHVTPLRLIVGLMREGSKGVPLVHLSLNMVEPLVLVVQEQRSLLPVLPGHWEWVRAVD
jgi:hypothetical protein